jgi:hypothetical protein
VEMLFGPIELQLRARESGQRAPYAAEARP